MKVTYSDQFILPLPSGHRFPLPKYAMLRQRVVESGLFSTEEMIPAEAATDEQLQRAHTAGYVARVTGGLLSDKEMRRIGFPWSPELVERSRRSVGATIMACRAALAEGLAVSLAGGTHHAYADHGEGYCVFNDVAVAARQMQVEGLARRIAILDCDVHQGNGTAAIFRDDESVFTFSIHGEKNFPFHKETSDLDIALPDQAGDDEYLEALQEGIDQSLTRAQPDLAIYLAGADPYLGDRLGRLCLTKEGLARRERLVFSACREVGAPIAITMAGGYARHIADTVDIHFQTLQIARDFARLFP